MATKVELDDVLEEVGEFGPYQVRLFCAILGPIVFSAVYNAQYVFNAADVNYRCVVPECETSPQWEAGAWAQWTLVDGSRCERLAPIAPGAGCDRNSFSNATQLCTAWVYQTSDSIVAEFDLACQDWKRTMVGTVHSAGVFTTLLYIGVLSDSIGRRPTFILAASAAAVSGSVRSFATSFPMYLVLEYLDSALGAGTYCTGFVFALEMIGARKRVLCGSIIACVFALGQVALALIAWAVPYWRTLTRILYVPSFFFLFYFLCLDESFRWLFVKKKQKETLRVLSNIAKTNKRTLTEQTVQRIVAVTPNQVTNPESKPTTKRSMLRQVLSSRILLCRLGVCLYCWVTSTFVYYGLSINSVSLAGNMYVNYILVSLVEIPGYMFTVFTLDHFGRKASMISSFSICGTALILMAFIPTDGSWKLGGAAQLALAMVGKLFVSAAFNGLYVFTSELFPTPIRSRALTTCSLVARLGQIVAMLTPLLLSVVSWLPFLLFGGLAVCAALALLLTPETLRAPLPDTLSQAERLSDPPELR